MTNRISENKQLPEEIEKIALEILQGILGEEKISFARPLFIKNRTLTVSCANSEVAQEIGQNQQEIVEKINLKLGKKELDRVRYLI